MAASAGRITGTSPSPSTNPDGKAITAMDQPAPAYLSVRQPRLEPVLLLLCGAVGLYLVVVSHFVVSCLDQIRQAVEATRQS